MPHVKHRTATPPGHAFRRREIKLDDGKLMLQPNGTISRLDGSGQVVQAWMTGDPDWPRQAIRFGLLPQPRTVAPPDSIDGDL